LQPKEANNLSAIKHIGRLKASKRRVIVAYRTIPNDPYHALVIFTDSLSADEHDSLIKTVESAAGQQAYELAEAMIRNYLPDGRNMLHGFHHTGKLFKIATNEIEMTPDIRSSVSLDELNRIIAQQQGVSLEELALKPTSNTSNSATNTTASSSTSTAAQTVLDDASVNANAAQNSEPLSDEQLAIKYRSDADRMYKEAKRLREMAEQLAPTKKKTVVKSDE
jgi:hypothetical protein